MNRRAVLIVLAMTACTPAAPTSPPTPAPAKATATSSSTSTSTTWTTTGIAGAGLAATDRLQRTHRLAAVLPHATAGYRIDFTVVADGRLALRVTLLAVLNDAADQATYDADLRRYRAEALAFIAAQGDDPATYTVTFFPTQQPTTPKEGP